MLAVNNAIPQDDTAARLLASADHCVMCGMCSAYCPTYAVSKVEAESPRGRVSLIQGLLRGEFTADVQLQYHLDRCLMCRSCERICPSGVPYGELIDGAQAILKAQRRRDVRQRLGFALVRRKPWLRLAGRLLRLYDASGLRLLARALPANLRRIEQRLPRLPPQRRLAGNYPATGPRRGEIALFTGCVAEITDATTLAATVRLLNRCGYDVAVPDKQACCGALHLHNGDPATAAALAQCNRAAFAAYETIVATASGCSAVLREYDRQPIGRGAPAARVFAAKVRDITALLPTLPGFDTLRFRPLPQRVAVHLPCSLRNVLRAEQAVTASLRRIPALEPIALPDYPRCCGAAGSHVLTQPDLADELRERLLSSVGWAVTPILVSANVGCAMHLAAGLRARDLDIEVVHPVVLLARQLIDE